MSIVETVAQVAAESGAPLCVHGHAWEMDGGRACSHIPKAAPHECSQPVYRCARCGAWDYGEPGGPGFQDCMTTCENKGFRK